MENLNAEQVKKALECCFAETMRCEECPRYGACREGIAFDIPKCTLAIINSQEQRIKELETRLCHLLQSKTIAKYDDVAEEIFSEIENTLKDCLWFLENHPSNYPTMDRTKIKVYKDTLSYLAELKEKYVKSEET